MTQPAGGRGREWTEACDLPLVVIVRDLEGCDGAVLQDLVTLCYREWLFSVLRVRVDACMSATTALYNHAHNNTHT